jgi:hypothetical protein
MKHFVFLLLSLFFIFSLQAQTKIFKEVGEDISTVVRPISQDNALVGYLAFTRLERADADSFNYRLTIMDENLNDIGAVNFRQEDLELKSVTFEGNVLCLGYIQSPLARGESIRTQKDIRRAQDQAASRHLLLQFINLNGKVINTFYREINLTATGVPNENPFSSHKVIGFLKYGMQLKNIPNGGFCLFYGDDIKVTLLRFDAQGTLTHEQAITEFAEHYYLHTSRGSIYLLTKKNVGAPEGGFRLFVYAAGNLDAENSFDLRDADDNWLKVLNFDNDPATGNPFIAGCIINPRMERHFVSAFDYANIPYLGLFTLDLGGPNQDMHANCSYWSKENMPGIGEDGLFTNESFFVKFATAFRDYNGNTIFAGTALRLAGEARFKLADGVFVRQEASGTIALDNAIPCDETKSFGPTGILYALDKKDFYKVVNPDTRNNYMIVDDEANIYIYDVNTKKVMRTIQHKDGNVKINVYPAKEGHIMVSEFNRKEKYTRFSIEAI